MTRKMLLSTLMLAALILALGFAAFQQAGATSYGKMGLVLQLQDESVVTRCIEIDKDPFSGYDALLASGYAVIADFNAQLGAAVCKVDTVGCAAEDCFCDPARYWSYWHLGQNQDGQPFWKYSTTGSSSFPVTPGGVEGWRYSSGSAPIEKPSFEEICLAEAATPTQNSSFSMPTFTSAPTRTAAPPANFHPPTSPPVWATAIIIGEVAPMPSPTSPAAFAPTSAPALAAQSLAPETNYIAPTQAAEAPTQAQPAAAASSTPVLIQPTPDSTQPAALEPLKPKKKATSASLAAALQKSELGAVEAPAPLPAEAEAEDQNASEPGRISRWLLVFGGLAGLGSFSAFGLFLLGGLAVIVYLKRR